MISFRLYPWGNKHPNSSQINIWEGKFPAENTAKDGYAGTAPVDHYLPQNKHGLHNIVGNVWEWTKDWHTNSHSKKPQNNPVSKVDNATYLPQHCKMPYRTIIFLIEHGLQLTSLYPNGLFYIVGT